MKKGILKLIFALALLPLTLSQAHAFSFDPSLSAIQRAKIQKFLVNLGSYRGGSGSPLHQQTFSGGVDGRVYLEFLQKRIKIFGYDANHKKCSRGSVACAITSPEGRIWLTEDFFDPNEPWVYKQMIILHEARHLEAERGYWLHSICPVNLGSAYRNDDYSRFPSPAGTQSCDDGVQGGYGTMVTFAENLSKYCTNCSTDTKIEAAFWAFIYQKYIRSDWRNYIVQDIASGPFNQTGPLFTCEILETTSPRNTCPKKMGSTEIVLSTNPLRGYCKDSKLMETLKAVELCRP